VVVERRIDLVQQTEGRGIEIEDREHERHRGERLLAAGQEMNGAVALAGGRAMTATPALRMSLAVASSPVSSR